MIGRKLAAYSCGGSRGIEHLNARTAFPFDPLREPPPARSHPAGTASIRFAGASAGASRSPQNFAVMVSRAASGSTGCSTLSITPFWHTAAGGGVGELHAANRLSVLIREPYA